MENISFEFPNAKIRKILLTKPIIQGKDMKTPITPQKQHILVILYIPYSYNTYYILVILLTIFSSFLSIWMVPTYALWQQPQENMQSAPPPRNPPGRGEGAYLTGFAQCVNKESSSEWCNYVWVEQTDLLYADAKYLIQSR